MPLQIKPSSGSGSITLQATTGTTTNDTLTLPAKTGNIITSADSGTVTQAMIQNGNSGTPLPGIGATGPAFYAQASTNQTVTSGVATKVNFGTEIFDTNNNFASSRFTPTIAGYYQFNFGIDTEPSGSVTRTILGLYRDSSPYMFCSDFNGANYLKQSGSVLAYMNGSTNYMEVYAFVFAATPIIGNANNATFFQASLVRAA